jgi:hypothetical protein
MELAGCTEEEAIKAYDEHEDMVEAIVSIMDVPQSRGNPKPAKVSEVQQAFTKIRKEMEALDDSIKTSSQRDSSCLESSHSPALAQEETKSDFDRIQQSHLATLEEEEQKQETACPSPSVCFCD